ncbi:MAG: ATP-grasp domain-containing protein, partial [Gammaproteobacteria bacterium]|nr:ATP-grasp domain-containing protein [Gammaproteobacteria bacterium]
MHKRVLIANRGEIAIRVAKAASALGMESVGVYAPADSFSLHTRFTTESRRIGHDDGDPLAAYLDAEGVVDAAVESGCDCVHPGYGFLSENPRMAKLSADAGLAFIGPSAEVLALFGDKVRARELARAEGIPVIAGSGAPLATPDAAAETAESLGYPVMLKACAGGGGRGMRSVDSADDIEAAFESCRREAESAFGDGRLFVERLLSRPRHIEVQVLADTGGNVVHLHERDCSIQRRNQKVIEVAPAPALDDSLRNKLLGDAVRLARAAGYVNAGTVEFLVVPETGEYYFIECNPRIQVEHTVTELVTGIDIVEAQFQVAAGKSLHALGIGDQQAVGSTRGFAVQARVVIRDAGTISAYKEPSGPGVRVDACGYAGYAPPPQFDPLLAKVVGASNSSASFESAVDRTLRALNEFHISGLPTNLSELRGILSHPEVRGGDARTCLLTETPSMAPPDSAESDAISLLDRQAALYGGMAGSANAAPGDKPGLSVLDGQRAVECPIAGTVVECRAAPGASVALGEPLLVVSAMKMETVIAAPCAG